MSELTPLQQLDEAIQAYAAKVKPNAGTVGAWVLSFERSRVDPDSEAGGYFPVVYNNNYAVGPAGSGATAIGICRLTIRLIEDALTRHAGDDE